MNLSCQHHSASYSLDFQSVPAVSISVPPPLDTIRHTFAWLQPNFPCNSWQTLSCSQQQELEKSAFSSPCLQPSVPKFPCQAGPQLTQARDCWVGCTCLKDTMHDDPRTVVTRNPPLSVETFYKCFSSFIPLLVIKLLLLWLNPCSGQKLPLKEFNLAYFHNSKRLFSQNRTTPLWRQLIHCWSTEPGNYSSKQSVFIMLVTLVTWARSPNPLRVPTPWLRNGDISIYLTKVGYREILLTRTSVNFRLTATWWLLYRSPKTSSGKPQKILHVQGWKTCCIFTAGKEQTCNSSDHFAKVCENSGHDRSCGTEQSSCITVLRVSSQAPPNPFQQRFRSAL